MKVPTELRFTSLVVLGMLLLPRAGRADVNHVMHTKTDDRGSAVHAVPLWNDLVRMAAERVVLVPYYDAKEYQPRLMCHVWYDLVNEGPRTRLSLGFPELKAYYRFHVAKVAAMLGSLEKVDQRTTLPTITAFGAREGDHHPAVSTYPGVGRYRRWFTFGVDLAAGQKTRVHNTYLATLGHHTQSMDRDQGAAPLTSSYVAHYVLHTGARWRGPIGQGEIYLETRGDGVGPLHITHSAGFGRGAGRQSQAGLGNHVCVVPFWSRICKV
jgi:hypothetical protein